MKEARVSKSLTRLWRPNQAVYALVPNQATRPVQQRLSKARIPTPKQSPLRVLVREQPRELEGQAAWPRFWQRLNDLHETHVSGTIRIFAAADFACMASSRRSRWTKLPLTSTYQ
jgi:hypothetical protein